jgi:hypothetical protein
MDQPLFKSAGAALAFAFNFSMQQYDRPLMNRLASGRLGGDGMGLSGQDGAGQAGMIRAKLAELPYLHQAILVAKNAPPRLPCHCGAPCCVGKQPNFEWQAAVRAVADHAEPEALEGCTIHRGLTLGLLANLFGNKVPVSQLAEEAGVTNNTATNHLSRLRIWLRGESKGKKGQPARIGAEQRAMAAADAALSDCGMVGMPDEVS